MIDQEEEEVAPRGFASVCLSLFFLSPFSLRTEARHELFRGARPPFLDNTNKQTTSSLSLNARKICATPHTQKQKRKRRARTLSHGAPAAAASAFFVCPAPIPSSTLFFPSLSPFTLFTTTFPFVSQQRLQNASCFGLFPCSRLCVALCGSHRIAGRTTTTIIGYCFVKW